MDVAERGLLLENRWDDAVAASLSPEALLVYRSNLLGSDKRITNYGGGNTSSKLDERDPPCAVGPREGVHALQIEVARRLIAPPRPCAARFPSPADR